MMKKFLLSLFLVAFVSGADAGSNFLASADRVGNPFFGDKENQFMINFGQGVNSFSLIPLPDMPVPFWMIEFAYSQPVTFFRLPARGTISAIKTLGHGKKYGQYSVYALLHGVDPDEYYEWDWQKYATEMAHLSLDTILYHRGSFYTGLGITVGVQGRQNARFGTKFMTGFKMFAGWQVSDRNRLELIMQHFSNGDTGGDSNYSYNFWGLGFGRNF